MGQDSTEEMTFKLSYGGKWDLARKEKQSRQREAVWQETGSQGRLVMSD